MTPNRFFVFILLLALPQSRAQAEELTLGLLQNGIADIQLEAVSKPLEVFSMDVHDAHDVVRLLVERVDGSIRGQRVYLYTIAIGPFFDFVVFDEPAKLANILRFFEGRWKWIGEGVEKGFLHFNEDLSRRFTQTSLMFQGLGGGPHYGSAYRNRIFNEARSRYLKRYATHLRAALDLVEATSAE